MALCVFVYYIIFLVDQQMVHTIFIYLNTGSSKYIVYIKKYISRKLPPLIKPNYRLLINESSFLVLHSIFP